jgi:hypothetical protein
MPVAMASALAVIMGMRMLVRVAVLMGMAVFVRVLGAVLVDVAVVVLVAVRMLVLMLVFVAAFHDFPRCVMPWVAVNHRHRSAILQSNQPGAACSAAGGGRCNKTVTMAP